nr:protein dopey 1 [Hymenolepis microstoma]
MDDVEIRISGGFARANNESTLIGLESYNPSILKEIIDEIDSKYYYAAIDCSEYEMQHVLAQSFRDQESLTKRIHLLERQSDAVCRQLSHLILEKQPHYQRELAKVLELQEINGTAYEECIEARRSLETLMRTIVEPRAIVIRNSRRRLRLKSVLETLKRIQALQNSVKNVNKLISEHKFCEAISMHRKICQITDDFKAFNCAESLQQSLRTVNMKIDDALDDVLAESCENFNPESYSLIQKAYERLGSTMTIVAQLQLHYTAKIHVRAAKVVLEFTGANFSEDYKNIAEFERLCESLPVNSLVRVLSKLAKALWSILVCYHRTALWHECAAQSIKDDAAGVGSATNNDQDLEGDSEVIHSPEMVRQWHGYVASKLSPNRGRVWMDVVSRVKPLLSSIANNAKQLEFEEIVATLNIVNLLVRVGKEFAGHMSFDLLEVLKNSIRGFFGEFHRKHMERLCLFLDHESWEYVPVRHGFSLRDLHEFNALAAVFEPSEERSNATESSSLEPASPNREKIFKEPYECKFFDLSLGTSEEAEVKNLEEGSTSLLPETIVNGVDSKHDRSSQNAASNNPILASTTIEVLRLLGRYIQMMRLLRPIASDVMHSIGQIFDYYLYVVYCLFGRSLATKEETNQLPEHLRKTLTRISTRLIASAGHPSVENGTRFVVPDCILPSSSKAQDVSTATSLQLETMDDINNRLRQHIVGVESLVYLASVLEKDLLPHIRECLPESKRGLLGAFRDQSLVTTLEVRETTARFLASRVLTQLFVLQGHNKQDTKIDSALLLRQMISTNPGWTSKVVATEPSAYLQSVNAVVLRFSSIIKACSEPCPPQQAVKSLWMGAMAFISAEFLEGLAGVHDCTEEGRSQMLLDVQSTALLCETESRIRQFVNLNLLVDYIQAYFVPTRDFASWLETTGVNRYTQKQSLGLANCLARGDKNTRQKLLATVTSAYARYYQQTSALPPGGSANGLIQQYDRYDVIPKKRLLGKRLAQCLHPALPPGVHCKTLECFELIFPIMGPDNLAADIGIYGPCIFGLLGPSAMTVKPLLFNLFETYFLPLGDKLHTSFLGLLQGLLPGLEEGSEFFERGNLIIEKFCKVVGPEFFYSSLWQVLIQAPSVRHFGTAYILNHFNKRRHLSTQAYIFGTSTPILLESVRCLLGDAVVLVQRDTLDFVILTLPVHIVASGSSSTKQPVVNYNQHPLEGKISSTEMRDLVAASLGVLLRKDASLNRRLFIWLLGSQNMESADASQHATTVARMALPSIENENDSTIQQEYFKQFSLPLLTDALHSILQSTLSSSSFDVHSSGRSACFRPLRLMSALLNRSEVGSVLVEQVLVDVVFFTFHMCQRLQQEGGGGRGGGEKILTPSSPSSALKRVQNRNLPQQTVDMLAQFESYAEKSGNRSQTNHSNRGVTSHQNHNRLRPLRLSTNRRLHQRQASEGHLESSSSLNNFNSTRSSTESEFLQEAELFFSNLESGFLWPFLQQRFFISSSKVRQGWVSAVRFLIEHLPIDTYPDVRGCYLPRMLSALSTAMCERMGQLSLAEIADFMDLLGVLIGHIQEHMVTMLDQSLAETSRPSTGSLRISSTSAKRDAEVRLISGIVGDIRNLLAAFFKQFLAPASSNVIEESMEKLRRPEKNLHALESEFCEFMNPQVPERDRSAVIDLLAQLCRLVVDMCNVPIVQPSENTQEEFNFKKLFNSGPIGDEKSLPDWLAYLVAGSALSTDFDTKTICLHTILDLIEASTSIHGWTTCVADQQQQQPDENSKSNANTPLKQSQWGPSGLLLPILAKEVLNTLASTLDFFSISAVTLWTFLSDSTYAEDAASLILRVISVSPHNNFASTEALVENFFVQQLLSSDPQIRLEAHRRFILLWKLLRHPSASGNELDRPPGSGSLNGDSPVLSFNNSGWRRAAMGLPPFTTELAPNVPNFNRCLLILLDGLEAASPPTNALNSVVDELSKVHGLNCTNSRTEDDHVQFEIRQAITNWLFSALSSGQAGRILAPLFATLLHPSTARTSLISIRNRRRRLRMAKKRRNRRQLRQQTANSKHGDVDGQTKETDGALFSGDESEDADEGYEEFDADLELEDGDLNDYDYEDEWEEYDRNICALSGGSPSGEVHFFVSNRPSQVDEHNPGQTFFFLKIRFVEFPSLVFL